MKAAWAPLRWILARRWRAFLAMGLSFFVFGACSLNLFFLFKANAALLLDYGWMALADGGAAQLLELVAYLLFKACEYSLVHSLVDDKNDDKAAAHVAHDKDIET
jgi:hypothetical protein